MIFFINFLLAVSTTIGMAITPIIMTETLGLSLFTFGLLEGITEFVSNILKAFNGIVFDNIKNKKILFLLSTFTSFFSKVLLFFFTPLSVFFSKCFERISNGMFSSPRDAYVATMFKNKGKAIGFLSLSKAIGCTAGPLIVSSCYFFNVNSVVLFSLLCITLTSISFFGSFFLKNEVFLRKENNIFEFDKIKHTISKILPVLIICFLFFLCRFNDGVLMLFLKKQGFHEWFYMSTIAVFNFVSIIFAPIIGAMIDKKKYNKTFLLTFLSMILFSMSFIFINLSLWILAISGLFFWGIQRVASQIVFVSQIFERVEKESYGTAVGMFYITSGLATMISSSICGYLNTINYNYTFCFSLFFGMISIFLLGMEQWKQVKAEYILSHSMRDVA